MNVNGIIYLNSLILLIDYLNNCTHKPLKLLLCLECILFNNYVQVSLASELDKYKLFISS